MSSGSEFFELILSTKATPLHFDAIKGVFLGICSLKKVDECWLDVLIHYA